MSAVDHWQDANNARMYDEFARRYPMYRLTSADLVQRADLTVDSHVLDLACGTGVTTEAILSALGPAGRVTAVDASSAMLQRAQQRVRGPRVTWLQSTAETINASGPAGGLTHVVCNSAIWQLDLSPVMAAVSHLLAPGGRFVCNLGTNKTPYGDIAEPPRKPALHDLMRAFAVIDHNFVWRPSAMASTNITEEDVRAELSATGMVVEPTAYVEYDFDAEQLYAWNSIPIFTEHFTGLTYCQRMDALNKAYAKLDADCQPPSRWAIVVAYRP